MHVPAHVRILVTSLSLAALSILTIVATALADSGPVPLPK